MSRIVYLSWPANEVTGGIKMAFRHVEALREAGFEAIVATPDGMPPGWFKTSAPVYPLTVLVPESDIFVLPENYAVMLKQAAAWPNRKVVFCQNTHMVYRGLEGRRDYREFGVSAILCAGPNVAAFCRRRCPSLKLYVVPNYVDRRIFFAREPKRLQIAFSPRKRPLEAAFIRDLFQAENVEFRSVPWVPIAGLPESEVARILSESALYLSLCRFETFALSILEAMASDCVVAGFTGFGAREYTTDGNGFWAEEDDCLDANDRLVQAARLYVEGGDRLRNLRESCAAAGNYYDRARFVRCLLETWRNFLAEGQGSGATVSTV